MAEINYAQGIGKEYTDPEERKRFLKDNADSVVKKTYMRRFTPEEMQARKEELAENAIEMSSIENEKREVMEQFKLRLKPLVDKQVELIRDIRLKATEVSGECYCFTDEESRMTYVINEDGDCIEAHPCTVDEMQKTVFETLRTGTEG